MNVPGWRLDWFAEQFARWAGLKPKALRNFTRAELRGLYKAYLIGLGHSQRRAPKAVRQAREFGELAADFGRVMKEEQS